MNASVAFEASSMSTTICCIRASHHCRSRAKNTGIFVEISCEPNASCYERSAIHCCYCYNTIDSSILIQRCYVQIGFDTAVEHPHKFILNYKPILQLSPDVLQHSWNFANDSLRSDVCLRFRTEVIACACVYMATRMAGVPMPENWWEIFDAPLEGTSSESLPACLPACLYNIHECHSLTHSLTQSCAEIEEIVGVIFSLYTRPTRVEYRPLTAPQSLSS